MYNYHYGIFIHMHITLVPCNQFQSSDHELNANFNLKCKNDIRILHIYA